jgi:transcriptional regulator with XRE-family HTH domain
MNEQLRRARIHAGLTQEGLARALGVSSVSIHRWERQGKKPGPFHRQLIGEFFHLPEVFFWPQKHTTENPFPGAGGPLLDPAIPLLAPTARLIGQQQLLKQVQQQLECEHPGQIISLIGWPGQGKTMVLQTLASLLGVQQMFDGVLWATVGQSSQPLQHLQRWGRLLGLAMLPESPEQARERIRMAIGDRRILFLLDDLWENEVFAYLAGGPQCRYVFTTRHTKLALAQSHAVYWVPDLCDDEAFTLLTRSLPLALVQTYHQRLEHLVQHVGKLPLALVLLGEYLRCEARAASPRRFEAALGTLRQDNSSLRIPCSMHIHTHSPCSLSTVISKSIQRLAPLPKKALALLVHALPMATAPFAEQQVMNMSQPGLHISLLDELVDAGLLEWQKDGRYWLHPVIAAYARVFLGEGYEQTCRAG